LKIRKPFEEKIREQNQNQINLRGKIKKNSPTLLFRLERRKTTKKKILYHNKKKTWISVLKTPDLSKNHPYGFASVIFVLNFVQNQTLKLKI